MSDLISLGKIGARRTARALPYDAEVEYLESTGTQYIGTGVQRNTNVSMEIQVAWNDTTTRQLHGCDGGFYFGVVNGYWQHGQTGSNHSVVVASQDIWYDAKMSWADGNKLTVDGVSYTYSRTMIGDDAALYLFAILTSPSLGTLAASHLCKCKIRRCKIYSGTSLVRDFIPVRFTNELGQTEGAMFDRANPTVGMNPDGSARDDGLYRNRGTGAFLYGNDI